MTNEKPFGLAFIGCGSYNNCLAKSATNSDKLAMIACFDVLPERAAEFAQKYGMESCNDLQAMLARDDVDGVVIASPNNVHCANAQAAAKARKHVFIDKPIANTLEDALAIVDATEGTGLTLAVGHNGRRMGGHRKMKELIEAGEIGTPVTVEANFSHSGGLGLTDQQWRFHRDQCPALPLMQLGVHFADTVQYLLGDVREVSSFMSHIATPADNDDVTVSILKFDKGLLGYLGSNYATPPVYYVNIYGTGGNVHCEWGGTVTLRKPREQEARTYNPDSVDTQIEELEEFADCARTGRKPEVDGAAAVKALAIVRGALESHETGLPVVLADLIARSRA